MEDTDYSLKNFEKKVTLFYSINTGDIKLTCGGIQDMSYFGKDRADFNYDFIVVDNDEYLLNNLEKFTVEDKKVKLKKIPEYVNKYEVAN